MMRASRSTVLAFTVLATAVAACGDDHASSDGLDDGAIELSLSSVPADAACLRVGIAGARSVTKTFALTPATSPTFMIDRLPAGVAQIDAQAFASACGSIASAVPAYVMEAPAFVRIAPPALASVALRLIQNGRLAVSVDFESQPWISTSPAPVDLAVLGDAPYGADQIADFPRLIADLSAAMPAVAEVVHLGDIKNGSSRCDTAYFQYVLDNVNASSRPFLYTPGDNEWTDCHRANNGAYDPLERLATLRSMFFPAAGLSLGVNRKQILSQSFFAGTETYVENQLWLEAGTVFALVHVVGSNNSLLPWYTDDTTGTKMDDPTRRTAEEAARAAAGVAWLDRAFAVAAQEGASAVVVIMQADMWDGNATSGFDSTVQKLAASALAFAKPVLLIEGDSHVFKTDNPFASGDPLHGVSTPVPNITRVVVQGSTTARLSEWLRLHVDPAATPPFSWTRVPNPRM